MLKLVNWKETVVDPDQELSGVPALKFFFLLFLGFWCCGLQKEQDILKGLYL